MGSCRCWRYLHVLSDVKQNQIIALKLTENEEKKTSKEFQKDLKKIKSKIIDKVYQDNQNITDLELKKLADNELEEYVTEYYEYKHEFMKIFDFNEYDDAVDYINELKGKTDAYPKR